MDLSEIVNEIDQTDGLYRNLIENIQTGDKMYAVPAKFYIPILLGDETYVSSANDYQSIADMAERAREAFPDTTFWGHVRQPGLCGGLCQCAHRHGRMRTDSLIRVKCGRFSNSPRDFMMWR